jgi:hypothetical protein
MMEHCPVCDKGRRAVHYCKRSAANCGLRGGTLMEVTGENAANHYVIRRDDYKTVNDGVLISADDVTGRVVWKDKTDTQKEITLGDHMIAIMRKTR